MIQLALRTGAGAASIWRREATPEVVEGAPGLRSVVLVEFPVVDSARAWYDAPEFQPLKAVRHRAVRNNAVLLAG